MEPRRPAGGESSGVYRDADEGGSSLPQQNGSGPGWQTDTGGRPRRQSDRVVRADSLTRRSAVGTPQRTGLAVGGWPLDPLARAGSPSIKWLQPLFPETSTLKACKSSSMQ